MSIVVIMSAWETREPKAAYPPFAEGLPLRMKERRDANVRYIFGFNPDRYTHCRPCQSDYSDFQG